MNEYLQTLPQRLMERLNPSEASISKANIVFRDKVFCELRIAAVDLDIGVQKDVISESHRVSNIEHYAWESGNEDSEENHKGCLKYLLDNIQLHFHPTFCLVDVTKSGSVLNTTLGDSVVKGKKKGVLLLRKFFWKNT